MITNLLIPISILPPTVRILASNGSILIIAIYVYVMRCQPEERRTSYSRHSLAWIGVKECIGIHWKGFHSFPIDRGWHEQSNHCTTVADWNHARRHATDSHCVSLQDHRQQRILMARSRPIQIWQDSFCRPPAHTTHHHLQISLLDIWTVVIASSFKIDDFPHKMITYLKNCWVEHNNHSFLANWPDWALSSHYLLWLSNSLSVHFSLDSTAPCGRPSASLEFIHSVIPPH